MQTSVVILGINPEPWAVGTASASRRGGVMKGSLSPNAKMQNYQNALREDIELQMKHWGAEKIVGERISLAFFFWRQIEIGHTGVTGRAQRGHQADVTNMQKSTEDALQGLLIDNDRATIEVYSKIVEQSEATEPGIVLWVSDQSIDSNTYNLACLSTDMLDARRAESALPPNDSPWG